MTCVILEKNHFLIMRLIFLIYPPIIWNLTLIENSPVLLLLDLERERNGWSGKNLIKGEFVSNGFSSNWLHFRRPKPFHMPPWYRLYGTFLTAELTCWPLSERFFRGWLERFFVEEGGGGDKGTFFNFPY